MAFHIQKRKLACRTLYNNSGYYPLSHLLFRTQRFRARILSLSSGGTYSGQIELVSLQTVTAALIHHYHKPTEGRLSSMTSFTKTME
jgi:hypothetical protein